MIKNFKFRTGNTAIIDENGDNFGKVVCNELGFEKLEFLGTEEEYETFIKQYDGEKPNKDHFPCLPEFFISGAVCNRTSRRLDDVSLKLFG